MPARTTLAELHEIIQIAFAWNDAHPHSFIALGRHYAAPSYGLDVMLPETALTLAVALPRDGAHLDYCYDPGECWDHTVLLESGGPDPSWIHPTCIDGEGDSPDEDWVPNWSSDTPYIPGPETTPFDLAAINRRLAALRSRD